MNVNVANFVSAVPLEMCWNIEVCDLEMQWRIQGGAPGVRPPTAQNFLDFMQFFGKIW